MSPFVITFGRVDGTASKSLYPDSRSQALKQANALSFVLFRRHHFNSADCHRNRRVADETFFIEYTIRRSQFGAP